MILLTVSLSFGVSAIALLFIRKKFKEESLSENHEFGGFLFNALGLIYAVLVAFVVFATWEEHNSAKDYCDKEANMLQDLYLNSEGLPEEHQEQIKEKVKEYLKAVIDEDWPLLAIDSANSKSRKILLELGNIYMKMDTLNDDKQKIIFSQSVGRLDEAMDYRRLRILSSQNHIPEIIWAVIIFGAITSIGFSLFFITKSFAVQLTMTALFILTNVFIILLILYLDHPFTGDLKILPDAYEQILFYLENPSK